METILILVLCLILKIVSVQLEGKKRREEEQARRRQEAGSERQEEVVVQTPKRKLPFEIPTMRQADPNAETKLPQADRIFIRREKTAEQAHEPEPKHQPHRASQTVPDVKVAVEKQSEQVVGGVNPLYQARLAMESTVHREVAGSSMKEEPHTKTKPRIPTDRERLVEGIILAEVLGKPKAYQNRRYMR